MLRLRFLSPFKSPRWTISLRIVLTALFYLFAFDAKAQVAKLPHVGVLTTISTDRPQLKGLRDGLKAAGYVIGTSLYLDMIQRKTLTELEPVARGFVKDRFDVLVVTSGSEAEIAQQTTREIPIVFMPADDPVRRGLVKSYARPGTNLTGLSALRDIQDSGKVLELFKALEPKLDSVILLSDGRGSAQFFAERASSIRRVAARLNIRYSEKFTRTSEQVFEIVSELRREPNQGVLLNCTALFSDLKRIAPRAKERGIALQGCSAAHVIDDSALFTYAPDIYQIGLRGAWYVDRILKGAKPQDLPVESPRKFEFVINLRTANAIGLKIPPEVLQQADRVIQ